jgi:uncharacterized membrane protein YbhN (UPF0104 family)
VVENVGKPARQQKRLWQLGNRSTQLLISARILGAVFYKYRGDLPSLQGVDRSAATLALVLFLSQPPLMSLRWWLLLRLYGSQASLPFLARVTWVSVFANQFPPASVGGDAVRIYAAGRGGELLGVSAATRTC